MKTIILASLVLTVTSATSFAGTPWINARQSIQSHRIYNGIVSGRITYPESQKLLQGQTHVQNLENAAKSDGVVTGWERAHSHRANRPERAYLHQEA